MTEWIYVPTESEYKDALKTVEMYEKYQKHLQWAKRELSSELQNFCDVKFKIDKDKRIVVFAGLTNSGQLKLGIAKCSYEDVFEVDIGKLIAVRRALNKNIDDISNFLVIRGSTSIKMETDKLKEGYHIEQSR